MTKAILSSDHRHRDNDDRPAEPHGPAVRFDALAERRRRVSTQRTPRRAGNITTRRAPGPHPATSAAGRPYSITNPATGTASTLAGMLTSGSRPNTSTLGNATPSWAPSVMPTGVARMPSRRQPAGEPRPDRADARRRSDRQPEPDRPHQQRIDENEQRDREAQHAERRPIAAHRHTPWSRSPPSSRPARSTARTG